MKLTSATSARAADRFTSAFSHDDHQPSAPRRTGFSDHSHFDVGQRASLVEPMPQVVSSDTADLLPDAQQVLLYGPTPIANYDFGGGSAPANRYEVEVDGQRIPVIVGAAELEAGTHQSSIRDIALALGTLPAEARAEIREVRVSPFQNPADAEYARRFDREDFRSHMTCGAQGIVRVYPTTFRAPPDTVAASLLHESAHAWSLDEWGSRYTGPAWNRWEAAAAADGTDPSSYALETPGEDLAETAALYLASRGTRAFDEYRAQFPNRFAILDERYGGG